MAEATESEEDFGLCIKTKQVKRVCVRSFSGSYTRFREKLEISQLLKPKPSYKQ